MTARPPQDRQPDPAWPVDRDPSSKRPYKIPPPPAGAENPERDRQDPSPASAPKPPQPSPKDSDERIISTGGWRKDGTTL